MAHARVYVTEEPTPFFFDVGYVAACIGIHSQTLRNQLSLGTSGMKSVRIGGKRMIPAVELQRFIAEKLAEAGIVQDQDQESEQESSPPDIETALPRQQVQAKRGPGRPRKQAGGAQ